VLRNLKLTLLRAAKSLGAYRLARISPWRSRQLLILCYHGISIDDEHEWAPGLFMSTAQFASRLALLRRARCNVLPLGEALDRLRSGTLPPRAVVLTFDDGNFDFLERAWPLLRAHQLPATVYLTTYYSERQFAVFPVALSYVLWKARGRQAVVTLGERGLAIDTRTGGGRQRARDEIQRHAQEADLSAGEKDTLVERLASALGYDYGEVRRRRLLHIMTPDEVRTLAAQGLDVQLHTHRHRSPLEEPAYRTEIAANRDRIVAMTGRVPTHFCYPSGVCMPQFGPWLEHEGVVSSTTCEPGMATASADFQRLPRLLDHAHMTDLEFEAWLTGLGALLPRREVGFTPVDRQGNLVLGAPAEPVTEALAEEEVAAL
jgi:peptidoglycan/xylan/chitin deacetylase (PgdA/CDA1 family)